MKRKIEAILYTLGKFITAEEIAKILDTTPKIIEKNIQQLIEEYKNKDSALIIQNLENKYKLNIKKEHSHITNKLLSDKEMDTPTTNTLAIIAYKAPVTQSEVIKIRGNKAYEHIKQLKESNLLSSEKQGRTRLLKLTSNFYDYFDIQEKELKQSLENKKFSKAQKSKRCFEDMQDLTDKNVEAIKKLFSGIKS